MENTLLTEIMVLREKNAELVEILEYVYKSDGWMSTEMHEKIQSLINSNITE